MPLDLTAAVAAFSDRFALQRRGIGDAFKVLGTWLTARLKQADDIERASRRYPRIGFDFGGGVLLRIDRSQHNTLASGEPGQLDLAFRRGGQEFVDGILFVGRAARQEWLLPNLLQRLREITDLVIASMVRFAGPLLPSDTFDPDRRTGSDLFGLAARGWRALAESNGQLQLFVVRLRVAKFLFAWESRADTSRPAATTSRFAQPSISLADQLDQAARFVLAGVLLLPVLPRYLELLFEAIWLRGRLTLIDELQGYERRLFRFRRRVIDFFFSDLPALAGTAFRFVLAAELVVRSNLRYFISFAGIYGGIVLREVRRFSTELQNYFNFFIRLVEITCRVLDAIMNFDLMPFIMAALGLPAAVLRVVGTARRLTLGDLLDAGANAVRIALYLQLTAFVAAIRVAMLASGVAGTRLYRRYVKHKLDLVQQILDALFQAPATYPAETTRPLIPRRFPNVFDAFFGPAGRSFVAGLQLMGRGLATSLGDILRSGQHALEAAVPLFEHQAVVASQLIGPATFRALDARAAGIGDVLFADQIRDLRRSVAGAGEAGEDRVANSFERWLGGGFRLIAEAIPVYLGELRRYWLEQQATGDEATVDLAELESMQPIARQKLARRLSLGRVRMEEVWIEARGRALGDNLVRLISERFHATVRAAHRIGRARLLAVQGYAT